MFVGSGVSLHAFTKQYGVKYPYLIAGAPAEMWEKVPQLVNLNTWPATVFVGRDGTVNAVHSGWTRVRVCWVSAETEASAAASSERGHRTPGEGVKYR